MADTTNVLGIPVPSTNPLLLGIVAIHVLFGLTAVVTGLGAMLSAKGGERHMNFGRAYFWSLAALFVTMGALSVMRWAEDYPLFILGTLAFAAACLGRSAIRNGGPRLHLTGMASSFVLMLTAFYVDNGKNLPVWKELPQIAFWFIPGIVGAPLTAYYLFRLPKFKRR